MKSYVTPMLSFESFELTSNTASACENTTHEFASGECGLWIGGANLFLEGITGCNVPVQDGHDGYCYHHPTDNNNLFNS